MPHGSGVVLAAADSISLRGHCSLILFDVAIAAGNNVQCGTLGTRASGLQACENQEIIRVPYSIGQFSIEVTALNDVGSLELVV